MPPSQQQNGWELRDVMRVICIAAALFSAFLAAGGIILTFHTLNDEVPAGKVQAILGHTKNGPRLRLDNGQVVVFSGPALDRQPNPVKLAVGDRVEKQPDSCVYVVNGRKLTNGSWAVRELLLPPYVYVPLAVYLLVGGAFVLTYRRTPHGDWFWRADPDRPRRPRTRAGLFAVLLGNWLLNLMLMAAFLGCAGGCLAGVGKAVTG